MGDVKSSIIEELHKPIRVKFPRRKVIVKGFFDLFMADLIDMKAFAKFNNGFKYILAIIDCFTKKAWAVALKSKSGPEVSRGMRLVLSGLEKAPKFLAHDQGGEFNNPHWARLMKNYNITDYNTYSDLKAQSAEVLIRTIKRQIFKNFNLLGTYNYLSFLDEILKTYNSTIHSTTGFAPNEINQSNRATTVKHIYKLNAWRPRKKPPKHESALKLKTLVRISKKKVCLRQRIPSILVYRVIYY